MFANIYCVQLIYKDLNLAQRCCYFSESLQTPTHVGIQNKQTQNKLENQMWFWYLRQPVFSICGIKIHFNCI